jgi:hypothetical protein
MRKIRVMMFARRVFREDTLALMVYPAIADLQFEGATGSMATLVRGYAALARALYGGLVHDFCADLRVLCDDAPDLLRAVAMQACYYAMMLTLASGAGFRRLSDLECVMIAIVIVALSVIPALVCFWPDRYAPAGTPNE